MEDKIINKGDVVYWARIVPQVNRYEVDELTIRTATDTYFVGTEKRTKQAFLFPNSAIGEDVFYDRGHALELVLAAQEKDDD